MGKYLSKQKIPLIAVFIIVFLALVIPSHMAHAITIESAGNAIAATFGAVLKATAWPIIGIVSYVAFFLSSIALDISSAILNGALYLTINIKNIVAAVPAIESTWKVIRDFSSIFFIAALIYAGIATILDIGSPNLGNTIKNIVIAGLLINFSLFFTKVAIDASNVVALSFYRAMIPQNTTQQINYLDLNTVFKDGGISDLVMQTLKVQTFGGKGLSGITDLKIIAGTFFASFIMIVLAISFLVAGIMFVIRTAILLLLLAFSPVYWIAIILPELKEYAEQWRKMLIGMCTFPIVYLLVMYVGLTIVTSTGFQNITGTNGATLNGALFARSGMGLFLQYTTVLIIINGALVAAISAAGAGSKSLEKFINKTKGGISGFVGRNTLGYASRVGGKLVDSVEASKFANSRAGEITRGVTNVLTLGATSKLASRGLRKGLKAGEDSKYGSETSLTSYEKEVKERNKTISNLRAKNERETKLREALVGGDVKIIKSAVSRMNNKEIEGVKKHFDNTSFAGSLSSKQVENILKSDELNEQDKDKLKTARVKYIKDNIEKISSKDMEEHLKEDLPEEDKDGIKNKRKVSFTRVVDSGDESRIKDYMKNLSGKELSKMNEETLKKRAYIKFLTESQLREMVDLDMSIKQEIGIAIDDALPGTHSSQGYVRKNAGQWGV